MGRFWVAYKAALRERWPTVRARLIVILVTSVLMVIALWVGATLGWID